MGVVRARRGGFLVIGLVLAGGKSSRFGEDKALVFYGGKRMIERSLDALAGTGLKPVVVTREGADYPFLSCPVLCDKLPEKGPLGGLWTAMSSFRGSDFLVLTCDMPEVSPAVLNGLLSQAREPEEILHYSDERGVQPFPGIYPASLFRKIGDALVQNRLSVTALLQGSPRRQVLCCQDLGPVFLNVNERKDL